MNKPLNKIEKLIAELCPKGVEFKVLGEVAKILRGASPRPIAKYVTDGENGVPWIKIGDTSPASKYVNKTAQKITPEGAKKSRILKKGDFIISNSMSFGRPYILNIDGAIHDGWASISDFEDKLNSDYLFHYLSSNSVQNYWISKINSGSVSNLNADIIKTLQIPIPPLAIQQEIVKILDTFTTLETELEAELEARKKQYEYYRDELLTFNERERVRWTALNEIGKVSMCKRIFKNETLSSGDIPFYKIGTFGKQPNAYISREVFDEYRKKFSFPKKGDVLLSASGTIGRRVIYNGEPAYFQDSNIIWIDNDESKVSNKFLYYLYAIIEWKTEGGTIQRLYNDNLKKIKIPIPPLAEQERIVAILDKFDALVNDISAGLPAELNARRKQYEYYRDKLLTFKKFSSSGKESNSPPHEGNHPALASTPPKEGNEI